MKAQNRMSTVALVVRYEGADPVLLESFSDETEIAIFESAVKGDEEDPLSSVYAMRERQAKEDEEFGNYVEDLLSQPFVRPEIQQHGLQWLKSKMRIEEFQRSERDATNVIAQYAWKLFQENSQRTDFILAGPTAKVRVKVFTLDPQERRSDSRSSAA